MWNLKQKTLRVAPVVLVFLALSLWLPASSIAPLAYNTAQGNTVAVTQRQIINFQNGTNTTVTVADNAGASRTDVTVNATPDGSASSGTFASLPTCDASHNGNTYQFTDSSYDLATCNGSAWTVTRRGVQLTVPPSTSWTADNSGSFSFTNGFGHLTGATSGGAVNMRGQFRTAPAAPYTLTVAVDGVPYTNGQDAVGYSVAFRDGSGKIVGFLFGHDGGGYFMQDDKWTSSTSFSAAYLKTAQPMVSNIQGQQPQWIRIQDNNTNLIFCTSFDGINWTQYDTGHSRTDFFAAGPTQLAFYVYTNGGAVGMNLASWATVGTAAGTCTP